MAGLLEFLELLLARLDELCPEVLMFCALEIGLVVW